MKTKAIISLLMMVAVILGSAIAMAANFTANPLTDVTSGGWTTTQGSFKVNSAGDGIISNDTAYACKAVHPVTTDASGAFSFESTFKLNNEDCDVHVGVSSGMNSGDITVGYIHGGFFTAVKDNSVIDHYFGGVPDTGATYTGKITSTDGNSFTCSLYQGSTMMGSYTYQSGFKPAYVVLYIENLNATNGPTIYSVNFQSQAAASPTPTVSPSATATPTPTQTPTKVNYDLQAIRDFYAKQPVEHMSNQSVVYNPDGTIKQVITGTQTTPVVSPTLQPTVKPNVTATATATPAPSNATAVPSTPAPTKAQSPGFEIVLATMGMLAALALITRKKK
ncbi:hypothetical protein MCP_2531 [Methanocella paludicola SANAE]|uniref:PGF-CTERM archaeal protein-sorting signal domain-containing protein n=1 Tax=Methanocella paludicola (strain DSM 17711 / JCM 13418 / NBRC 101707 / SANAE) TaxID=304371 RepID=D1Z1N1_METPS|nr:PGF-CTERM sorting domain-containing protein [Methanocella paludicola]BAI62603.1 hypothetical protein MCP_2531 [Methanocella paludicola SANAE]